MKHIKLDPRLDEFLSPGTNRMLIDGQWVEGNSRDTLAVVDPATEEVITQVYQADAGMVDQAVQSAVKAFHPSAPWRKMTPRDREKILLSIADHIESQAVAIAQLVTKENGKLYSQALSSDAMGAAHTFRYFAGWATKLEGETLDVSLAQKGDAQNFAFTTRQPVGVVAAIIPWNFPFSIAAWKVAPALAAGCTVVLKPSEETPLSGLYMGKIALEAGLPPGVLNVITGDGQITGSALTKHPGIHKITFTGSVATGQHIGRTAMDNLTDVSLELGGKSPAIVFDDVPSWEEAVIGVANGIFRNQGQVCVAGSRLYIQETIYDKFLADLAAHTNKLKLGNGFKKDVDLGPLISSAHCRKVMNYIDAGQAEGAEKVCGGQNPYETGYFLRPTILATTNNTIKPVQEEIFGPVLMALPFSDREEAIAMANQSTMGLAATIWTADIQKALTMIKQVEAGLIFVNSPVRSDPNLPLGGFKHSGIGRELGKTGVYNYTTLKSVNIVY